MKYQKNLKQKLQTKKFTIFTNHNNFIPNCLNISNSKITRYWKNKKLTIFTNIQYSQCVNFSLIIFLYHTVPIPPIYKILINHKANYTNNFSCQTVPKSSFYIPPILHKILYIYKPIYLFFDLANFMIESELLGLLKISRCYQLYTHEFKL